MTVGQDVQKCDHVLNHVYWLREKQTKDHRATVTQKFNYILLLSIIEAAREKIKVLSQTRSSSLCCDHKKALIPVFILISVFKHSSAAVVLV